MSKRYRVVLEKEHLIFSAAHFITFVDAEGQVICEQLHGHNYRVKCEVEGPLNDEGYVVDFIALRDKLKELVLELDHRVLLATEHPGITVNAGPVDVEVKCQSKRWVFPVEDCVLLPVSNTTAELLASYLGGQLIASGLINDAFSELKVAVDENEGQWGECAISLG